LNVDQHLVAFADAFTLPERRERWRYLLEHRRRNLLRHSSTLMSHLDPRWCVRVDGAFGLADDLRGVFYDFHEQPPEVLGLAEAVARGTDRDALFSIVPGKLAIHWSHEDWSWLCRR
jgi:hypothetical protein